MTRRLIVTYLLLAVVVLVALEVPLGIENQRGQRDELQRRVERDAVALAGFTEGALERRSEAGDALLRRVVTTYAESTGARAIAVDAAGRLVADSDTTRELGRDFATEERPEVQEALSGAIAAGTRRSDTLGTDLVYVAVPVASGGVVHGAVRVTFPTSRADALARRYWLVLGGVALVVLAAVALAGRWLAGWVSRPLTGLRDATRAAGAGDLGARADTTQGPPEVREVAAAFNEMVARLDHLVGAQEEFVADASHQLRSPLTALRLRLENLQAGVEGDAAAGLERAVAETERLARLIDGLLALARADRPAGEREPRDVGAIVRERAEAWRDAARERQVRLEERAPAGLAAELSPGVLDQVLDNLVANALEVAPPGTAVELEAAREDGTVVIRVADRGPGMTEEQRARAFDRFWRGDGGPGGSGLGLAIVRRLVEADGGTTSLEPAPGGGLVAAVTLPAARSGTSSP